MMCVCCVIYLISALLPSVKNKSNFSFIVRVVLDLNLKMEGILQQECVHGYVSEWQILEASIADEYNRMWVSNVEEMEMVMLFQNSAIISE